MRNLKHVEKGTGSLPGWNPGTEEDPEQKKDEKPAKVRFSDYLLLLLTGYGIILIPTVLFIAGLSLLAAWLFGAFR